MGGSVVGLSFFDAGVDVETHDDELAGVVRRLWSQFVRAVPSVESPVVIDVPEAGAFAARLGWLNSTLNSTAMDLSPCLCVHAGVVARGGRVVAFPARSGTGKSTLTGACLRRGFEYLSDEALCLSYDDATVRPYPRPLGLSTWTADKLGVTGPVAGDDIVVRAEDLGAPTIQPATDALRLTHIVLLDRRDGGSASLRQVHRREAVESLLRMSFNHYRRPAESLELVAAVVTGSTVRELTYSDPYEAADLLASAVTDSPLVDEVPHP
ncbi:MAG: hypothetical protein QOJ62_2097 [Actinomycetota bacterium]|nr:hypothetical protein [Actinomycetota bacterium]